MGRQEPERQTQFKLFLGPAEQVKGYGNNWKESGQEGQGKGSILGLKGWQCPWDRLWQGVDRSCTQMKQESALWFTNKSQGSELGCEKGSEY